MNECKTPEVLLVETQQARVKFVNLLKATAEGCADDYFRFVDGWGDNAPSEAWEAAWTDLLDGVSEGVTNLCHALGMDELTTRCTVDAALTFCFARFDLVNAALVQREGKVPN